MFDFVLGVFKGGIEKLRRNPQLLYTMFVAVVITGAFLFMADRFVGIATDAQERLINVRIGSLQDAFVSFAGDTIRTPQYLQGKIDAIVAANDTIRDFRIVTKDTTSASTSTPAATNYVVIASHDPKEVGSADPSADFLYSLSASDPAHSITTQETVNGERLFRTARAIMNASSSLVGVVMTTQTLSEADKAIQNDITNSMILLVVVLIIIMLLFLRHSKIIDYMALYKKLKEVDQLKDDFISMASHELRTPLTVIRGYADFIKEAPELTPETKKYVAMIDTSAKGLDSLVADVLDVSRMEQGRMSFKLAPLNPDALIAEVTSSFEMPAKEKDLIVSLEKSAVPENTTIVVDTDRLKQVLVNIIGNAVKYTAKGEVKVREYIEKGKLIIRVSDTGFGMSEEERGHLFEKFYRIKTDETKDIRGTGLGLWITAQIVKEMKGTLSVESIKGVGSHFIIAFPVSA